MLQQIEFAVTYLSSMHVVFKSKFLKFTCKFKALWYDVFDLCVHKYILPRVGWR